MTAAARNKWLATLQRRLSFLRARENPNSYDEAEIAALSWALGQLTESSREGLVLPDPVAIVEREDGRLVCSLLQTVPPGTALYTE